MTVLKDKWKLDLTCKEEMEILSTKHSLSTLEKTIEEKGKKFTDESYHRTKSGILKENGFFDEKKARENLLNLFLLYARVCERSMKGDEENRYSLLNETWKRIRDELNMTINEVFGLEINEKSLNKGKGESLEHYLMRYIILSYLDNKYGVKSFQEEYSKLKEIFKSFAKGETGKKEWQKVAKRADLYVVLDNETTLWIEVERTRSSSKLNKKLKRLKTMLSHFPKLFDKVCFVFPSLISPMAEATLVEAREVGFPDEKLEFYEVNLREDKIIRLINPKLVDVEFGDRLLDMIADGVDGPRKKTAKIVKENVVIPLINKTWSEEYVMSKKEKIRRLIHFWRIHTKKFFSPEEDIKFKADALKKIKQNYPFLLK